MVYDLGSSDISPEINRSRSLYSDEAQAFITRNNSNVNRGISYKAAKSITEFLPSAELVCLFSGNSPYTFEAVGGEGSKARRNGRYVDPQWWSLLDYNFIAGTSITQDDFDANRNVIVITERVARELFHTTDIVGREVLINFKPYSILGVVENVSSQFNLAYGDFWANMSAENQKYVTHATGSEGVNGYISFIALAKPGQISSLRSELDKGVLNLNNNLAETTFKLKIKSHPDYSFSSFFDFSPQFAYGLLIMILLIIPAVNISGLIFSMLDKRYTEIGIRKAYGASNGSVINLFLSENLLLILIGGIIGLLFSFLVIYLFRNWLLGVSVAYVSTLSLSWWMLFRPSVFLIAFVVCVSFNLLSTLIPVWYISRKNVVEALKG